MDSDLRAEEEETKRDLAAGEPDSNPLGDVEPEASNIPSSPEEQDEAAAADEPEGAGELTKEDGEITLTDPEPPAEETSKEADVKEPSTPRKPPKKSSKGPLKIKVVLLDGKNLDLEERHKANTETVVNPAHAETQTLELDFFSVYFYDDYVREHNGQNHHLKQKVFLIPRKQLRSQYSSKEKEVLEEPWEYHYGVKFYVPDPNNSRLLKDDHSRFLMCLQLCDDIRANRVHVDRETAIRLTAIMLQGKLGDYEEDTHLPGYYQEFPQFQLLPDSLMPDNYEAQLIQVHKAKAGYTPSQADSEFLSIAKDLTRYGEHLFLAKSHRDDSLEECRMVTIGNGCKGISVYCEGEDDLHVPWKDIVKISYKKDKFRIIYHPPEDKSGSNGKRPNIKKKFYTGQRPQAKRIWKNAVEQHVFFHLDSTNSPTIVSNIFLRSSMRYSFKKTLPSARKNPEPIGDQKDRPRDLVPIDFPPDDDDWVLLTHPPLYEKEDSKQQEQQKVQIDFKSQDQEPEAHRFIIHRDNTGSYEVVDKFQPEEVETQERTFSLSVVDENSKTSRVSVCLQVDPPEGVELTTGGSGTGWKGVPVFDSDRMPVVNLGSTSVVTTAMMIEQDGKRLTTGEHTQKYPLEEVTGTQEEGYAGPALDGLEEADQVNKFLEKEQEAFQRPGVSEPEPPRDEEPSHLSPDPGMEITTA